MGIVIFCSTTASLFSDASLHHFCSPLCHRGICFLNLLLSSFHAGSVNRRPWQKITCKWGQEEEKSQHALPLSLSASWGVLVVGSCVAPAPTRQPLPPCSQLLHAVLMIYLVPALLAPTLGPGNTTSFCCLSSPRVGTSSYFCYSPSCLTAPGLASQQFCHTYS